jgi:hypothetical protein
MIRHVSYFLDISPKFSSPGPLRTVLEIFGNKSKKQTQAKAAKQIKGRQQTNKQTNKQTTNTDIEFKQDGIHLFISIHHGGIPPDSSAAAVDIGVRLSDHNGG